MAVKIVAELTGWDGTDRTGQRRRETVTVDRILFRASVTSRNMPQEGILRFLSR